MTLPHEAANLRKCGSVVLEHSRDDIGRLRELLGHV
jgi:hypothetical protein